MLDAGGPFVFGSRGWQLVAHHFAERHGLIIIIALGESIIAIGVGAGVVLTGEVIVGAVLGVFLAATPVVDLLRRRCRSSPRVGWRRSRPGREQNELARDAYSYLHFPMVAGVVLAAFAMKNVLGHVDDPLHLVPACALGGGLAIYLLAHVAFKRRAVGILERAPSRRRPSSCSP